LSYTLELIARKNQCAIIKLARNKHRLLFSVSQG